MLRKEELYDSLISDLRLLELPVEEFDLVIRPYSKTYWGRYFYAYNGKKAQVRVYPYRTKGNKVMFPYQTILYHTIHEVCHHIQFTLPGFVRKKGVMHDPEFYRILDEKISKAEELNLLDRKRVMI